ncbi:MAG: DUF1592 domain-containing protein [Bryobacteraceae bacterium]
MRFLFICLSLPLLAADIQPLLDKYCARCHGTAAQTAGINFSQQATLQNPMVLRKALRAVRENEMPPAGAQPAVEEREAMVRYFETEIRRQSASSSNPGHVTLPRLNRVEYNNTIRDLTGIDLRPADSFPLDPPGESGFNNDREGLFISPLLIEKYLAAATYVVDEVLAAYRNRAPFHQVLEVEDMRNTETGSAKKPYGYDVIVVQNTIYEYVKLPRTGMYRFTVKAWGKPGKQGIPGVTVRLDGELVGQSDVTATQEKPGEFVFEAPAKRGSRRLSLHFYNARPQVADVNAAQGAVLSLDSVRVESASSSQNVFPEGFGSKTARQTISRFAANAWRRPLSKEEAESLYRTYRQAEASGLAPEEATGVALKAVLVSPHFLFRTESSGDSGKALKLSDYELAARLSYFLWQSMPDEELRRQAQSRKLSDAHTMQQQVLRMLKDTKAQSFVDQFFSQWLGFSELARGGGPDRATFPFFNDALRKAMLEESSQFFWSILQSDGSLLQLIDAKYTYLNEQLARHYQIAGVQGNEMRRVELDDPRRGGVVGMGSTLTATSLPVRTSPVLRGKWILEVLLGEKLPPPPANAGDLPEPSKETAQMTLRQRFEMHRKAAQCSSCHNRIDPLGYGLENFDATGRWRDKDNGQPVDAQGVLRTGETFRGPVELKQILLARKEAFARNLAGRALAFALGRELRYFDDTAVDKIATELISGGWRPSALVSAIARSYPFQYQQTVKEQSE